MTKTWKKAQTPQDLEKLLIERQWQGDLEGMLDLYEESAVLDDGSGKLAVGKEAIGKVFKKYIEAGRKFEKGVQQTPAICGNLALTSTNLPDGSVTAEVARRQADGTWLWVIDRFSVT